MLNSLAPFLSLRRLWRKLGFNHLFDYHARKQIQKELTLYKSNPKEIQKISLLGNEFLMRVTSDTEYMRIIKTQRDSNFLKRFIKQIRPNDTVWDIGASIGTYALLLASQTGINGKVIAFEPEPQSFQRLRENLSLNHILNIQAFEFALGAENASMRLTATPDFASGSHSLIAISDLPREKMVMIQMRSGDSFVENEKMALPQAIKIDVEGFEEEVLVGLKKSLAHPECRTVLCEVHFALLDQCGKTNSVQNILQILKDCGFHKRDWLDFQHLLALK